MRQIVITLAAVVAGLAGLAGADELREGFANPPAEARPRTWWHCVSGNVSRVGITADLEAMKRIGVGGAQMFNVDQSDVKGPVVFMSDQWRGLAKHAIAECARLGLELSMHGCEGWSESGGPWITPEQSMQKVVWSAVDVHGPRRLEELVDSLALPQPETVRDYYRDIAILAFPSQLLTLPAVKTITSSGSDDDLRKLVDGDPDAQLTITPDEKGEAFLLIEFNEAPQIASVVLTPWSASIKVEVQTSDDGKTFKKVSEIRSSKGRPRETATFSQGKPKYLKLFAPKVSPQISPWRIAEIQAGGVRVPDSNYKSGYEPRVFTSIDPARNITEAMAIQPEKMVDLTAHAKDGRFEWNVPAGDWTILRIGHTSTGRENHPAMDRTRGLECDKMSREAVEANFNGMMGRVIADSPELVGKGLHFVLLDSWEAGRQNWTPTFREEFQKRRGYDPLPWMPAVTGRYVKNAESTERFLWDYRRTIADLIAANHYGLMADLCHKNNIKLTAEAVGIGMPTVADQLQCKAKTDVPMGEFWVGQGQVDDPKETASAAHIFGKTFAAAEAFTATPEHAGWTNDPFSLKALGDKEFCLGINRFVFHRYAHQPWMDRVPGMTMGPWGINFERTNTWWEPGAAWISYLSRCQYLLQRGQFVADVLYFYGEGAPVNYRPDALKPAPPKGHDFDVCDAQTLLKRAAVRDGLIVLESGMAYRVLVLPETDRMTPELAQAITKLVNDGATVVGPKPTKSPSLSGGARSDEIVRAIGEEIWGDLDGTTVKESAFGKGRVIWGMALDEILRPVGKDFEVTGSSKDPVDVRYIHRRDGDVEIYFVASQLETEQAVNCTFRMTGKAPELWYPDSGRIEQAAVYAEKDGMTTVPIRFEPAGSVFIVFRAPTKATDAIATVTRNGRSIFELPEDAGSAKLQVRRATYGALDDPAKSKDVTELVSRRVRGGVLSLVAGNDVLGGDPAFNIRKQLRVEYVYAGRQETVMVGEGQALQIPPTAPVTASGQVAQLRRNPDGKLTLIAWKPGDYEIARADGERRTVQVKDLRQPLELAGAWDLRFQPERGAPASVKLDHLVSWTGHADSGVRYFSGTAVYGKALDLPADLAGGSRRLMLDLGEVKNLARVRLNGKDLGVVWKPPFAVDVTDSLKAGPNQIEIEVTNLWPNRLIGDQHLPEAQRTTWTSYNPYKKDSPLLPSGLLGPVRVLIGEVVEIK